MYVQLPPTASTYMSFVKNSKENLWQKKAPITVGILIPSKWILFVVQLGLLKLHKLKINVQTRYKKINTIRLHLGLFA